jgi:hypothetical protein
MPIWSHSEDWVRRYRSEHGTARITMPLSLSGGRIQPPSGSTTRITGPVLLSCCAHLRAERALLRKTRGRPSRRRAARVGTVNGDSDQRIAHLSSFRLNTSTMDGAGSAGYPPRDCTSRPPSAAPRLTAGHPEPEDLGRGTTVRSEYKILSTERTTCHPRYPPGDCAWRIRAVRVTTTS